MIKIRAEFEVLKLDILNIHPGLNLSSIRPLVKHYYPFPKNILGIDVDLF